jgi:hypothetical protein
MKFFEIKAGDKIIFNGIVREVTRSGLDALMDYPEAREMFIDLKPTETIKTVRYMVNPEARVEKVAE